jgi:Leucine-rich repeat (LRR) protein
MTYAKYWFIKMHSWEIKSSEDYDRLIHRERELVQKIEQRFGRCNWWHFHGRIISMGIQTNLTESQWETLGRYIRFPQLQVIRFENMAPFKIPAWIARVRNLREILFGNIPLNCIPIQLFSLRNLYSISFAGCGLKEIPAIFKSLSKLRRVNFYQNNIAEFPEVLFEIPTLVFINLSKNPIVRITDSWESLPNLEKLWLKDCEITYFPDDLYRIPIVALHNNPLEINNGERLDQVLWGKPWRFEDILIKCRQGHFLDESDIDHPLYAKYRTELLAQCEGIQNATVDQIRNTPVRIRAARGRKILL